MQYHMDAPWHLIPVLGELHQEYLEWNLPPFIALGRDHDSA